MSKLTHAVVGATAAVAIIGASGGTAWADDVAESQPTVVVSPAPAVSDVTLVALPQPGNTSAFDPLADLSDVTVLPVDQPMSQDDKINAALGVAATKFGLASGMGAATGALIGGVAGCLIGATTMSPLFLPGMAGGCLAGGAAGAGLGSLAGTVIVGLPVGVAAGIEAWNKINAPTPPTAPVSTPLTVTSPEM
ncbi:hypothetical protein [Nocardia sp. NPDC059239]|uniref:hypothetical protein n=1 Tax=unclassified Nocardia TaxID=2637762 RepID=UPI0036AD968A